MKKIKMVIGKKVIKDLLREKTIIFTILLQLFIILASSIILTNSNVLFNPQTAMNSAIGFGFYGDAFYNYSGVDNITEVENSEKLVELFERDEQSIIFVKRYQDKKDALEAFQDHEIDALVGIENFDIPLQVDTLLPKGEIKTSVTTSIVRDKLRLFEDYLRHQNIENKSLVELRDINMKNKSSSASASLFEALYNIVIPFLILLPGILLGGLIIDILFEDLETKTINLLMIITNFRKYIYEILITILGLSMLQVLIWEFLLIFKGISIAHLPLITSLTIFVNLILFMFAVLITLLFQDKTRAQITFSFLVILMFVSAPLSVYNPIRMITKLSIGLENTYFFVYAGVLVAIIAILTGIITYVAEKKEW